MSKTIEQLQTELTEANSKIAQLDNGMMNVKKNMEAKLDELKQMIEKKEVKSAISTSAKKFKIFRENFTNDIDQEIETFVRENDIILSDVSIASSTNKLVVMIEWYDTTEAEQK